MTKRIFLNMRHLKLHFFIPLIFIPYLTMAQDGDKKIYSGYFENTRAYRPKLSEAMKIKVSPVNEKMEVKKPVIKYLSDPKLIKMDPENDKLPPLAISKPKVNKLDHFYIRAGAGNYAGLLAEIHYNTTQFKDKYLAAELFHRSGDANAEYSHNIENKLNLSGYKIFGKNTMDAKLFASNTISHYYGFNSVDSVKYDTFQGKDILQNIFVSGINLGFTNELNKKASITYKAKSGFYYLFDHYDASEMNIRFEGLMRQDFFNNPFEFELKYNYFLNRYGAAMNRHILEIRPHYTLSKKTWRAVLGFGVVSESDSIENNASLYPDIQLQAHLFKNHATIYGGLGGGRQINSYYSLTSINPYLKQDVSIRNTNNKFELYGGLKGNFGPRIIYNTKLSYHNIKNLCLYLNSPDSLEENKFILVYDSGNTTLLKFVTDISATPVKDLTLLLNLSLFEYDLSKEYYAWHLPGLEMRFRSRYNLKEKFYFDLDLFLLGKRYAWDWRNDKEKELDPVFDVNAGITYKYNKMLGVFFQFNNILNKSYQYWNLYPVRGFHLLGGVKLNL